MRLKTLAVTGAPSACTFSDTTDLLSGVSRACTFTQSIPWANFTTTQNVSVSISASAATYATGGVTNPTATATATGTLNPVSGLSMMQTGSVLPATVTTVGECVALQPCYVLLECQAGR